MKTSLRSYFVHLNCVNFAHHQEMGHNNKTARSRSPTIKGRVVFTHKKTPPSQRCKTHDSDLDPQ